MSTLKSGRPPHLLEGHVEQFPELQVPKAVGETSVGHTCAKTGAEGQEFEVVGQVHVVQAFVEDGTKCQALKPAGQNRVGHIPVDGRAEYKNLQCGGQSHGGQALVVALAEL